MEKARRFITGDASCPEWMPKSSRQLSHILSQSSFRNRRKAEEEKE
jgi:hypothetical protein